jgi:hypothetical protein
MSMNLSHPKSENGLPLRWRTCTAFSTSMSQPSPPGVPPTHTSYAWMIARSSTSARSINLVNNPTPRLSPHGASAFPQTHDDDSPARPRVRPSSLDNAWSRRYVAARGWSRRGTVKPRHHALLGASMGEHARRRIDAWPCLEGHRGWHRSGIPVRTGPMPLVPSKEQRPMSRVTGPHNWRSPKGA